MLSLSNGRATLTLDSLGVDRVVVEVVALLVSPNLQRAKIVRPTAPVHRGVIPQIVVALGNVPGSAPLGPRNDPTEQRKRTRVEDAPLAAALILPRVRQQLEDSHRGGRRVGLLTLVLAVPVVDPVADRILRRWRTGRPEPVLRVDPVHVLALLHQLDHVPERDLQRPVDRREILEQGVTLEVVAAKERERRPLWQILTAGCHKKITPY